MLRRQMQKTLDFEMAEILKRWGICTRSRLEQTRALTKHACISPLSQESVECARPRCPFAVCARIANKSEHRIDLASFPSV